MCIKSLSAKTPHLPAILAGEFDFSAVSPNSSIGTFNLDERLEAVHKKMQSTIEDIDYEGTRQAAVEMLAML